MLEDNQVTLSTMKASRYVKAFEKEVDYWERTLSHILEVIEMTLQVQRQWMYLEVYTILKCTYLVNLSAIASFTEKLRSPIHRVLRWLYLHYNIYNDGVGLMELVHEKIHICS